MKQIHHLQSINRKSKTVLHRCKECIKILDPTADVILYGSQARGDAHEESDFDILILTDNPSDLDFEDRIRNVIYPIELETGCVLSFLVCSKSQWESSLYKAMPLHATIEKEGILL